MISLSSTLLVSNSAHAENLDYNVVIKPSLKITLSSNNPSLTLNPTNHTFDNTTITSTVATNNPNGYKLYLSTTEGSGGTSGTELVNNTNSTYTIPTLESASPASTFPANYWGYRLSTGDNDNYLSYIPDALIGEDAEATNGTVSTVDFAAKVDYDKPSGLYNIAFDLKTIPIVSQTYMQDMTTESTRAICKREAPTIVIDSRDEQPYLVQRLDDGKCWMLDNLNLDLTNKAVVDNITTANTNADAASLKSLKEGNRGAGTRYATEGLSLSNWTTDDSSNTKPMINKSGTCFTTTAYPCTYNGNYTNNTVLSTLTPDQSTFGLGSGKIGIYYNYCAASAGNYCYDDTGDGVPPSGAKADYDICPSSWRMPVGGTNGEYQSLCTAINGSTCGTYVTMEGNDSSSMQYKLSATLSGTYFDSTLFRQGSFGYFWSSSSYPGSASDNYYLDLGASFVKPYAAYPRLRGFSVRCLLQE